MRKPSKIFLVVLATLLIVPCLEAQHSQTTNKAYWLWVKDYHTGLGVAGAAVDIAPGNKCLGVTEFDAVKWTAHYTTNAAGRVLVYGLPNKLSCRVTVEGQPLNVITYGMQIGVARKLPAWAHLRTGYTATIQVGPKALPDASVPPDYWETTDDPALFRSYIQDPNTAELLANVRITALPSGITTTSDANGLFTLEIPASYRKGKFPASATQTLVLSKPGYKRFEYRQLVLNPGIVPLEVFLAKGAGTTVRINGSMHNSGNPYDDDSFAFAGVAPDRASSTRGEILSVEIQPFHLDYNWISCGHDAKVVVKARGLISVGFEWFPTGTGITESAGSSPFKKVSSSPEGDTWELPISEIMSTSFWVTGTDEDGHVVKSMDLGNVYCD